MLAFFNNVCALYNSHCTIPVSKEARNIVCVRMCAQALTISLSLFLVHACQFQSVGGGRERPRARGEFI